MYKSIRGPKYARFPKPKTSNNAKTFLSVNTEPIDHQNVVPDRGFFWAPGLPTDQPFPTTRTRHETNKTPGQHRSGMDAVYILNARYKTMTVSRSSRMGNSKFRLRSLGSLEPQECSAKEISKQTRPTFNTSFSFVASIIFPLVFSLPVMKAR